MNTKDFQKLRINAQNKEKETRAFFNKLKSKKPKNLDNIVHQLHDEFFENFDCLSCGNCCRSLGPRILQRDIERLSKHLKMKNSEFIDKYLRIDEDKDYVFKSMPCPFLDSENYCLVYEYRPKACQKYPHTDQRKFHLILPQTLKNTYTCPGVFEIVKQLKAIIK